MRHWVLVGLLLVLATGAEAQGPEKAGEDKAAELKQKLAAADLVVLGKVTRTGLSAASSFDVGEIEVREILKGDPKTKTARFRFSSSGGGKVAPYGKKGVAGVWILGKKGGYLEAAGPRLPAGLATGHDQEAAPQGRPGEGEVGAAGGGMLLPLGSVMRKALLLTSGLLALAGLVALAAYAVERLRDNSDRAH